MARIDQWLLSQDPSEVQATMQEEACMDCFGCPAATLVASEITQRTNLLLGHVARNNGSESQFIDEVEVEIATKRMELATYTDSCQGYNETRTPGSLRPAKMCNSPDVPEPRISIVAGRILELFHL